MSTEIATTTAAIAQQEKFDSLFEIVLDSVEERTRRDYKRALNDFAAWYVATGQQGFSKAIFQAHVAHLKAQGTPASSINQRLAALRKFVKELSDNGIIDDATLTAIRLIDRQKTSGEKLGNWLTEEQQKIMFDAVNPDTLIGKRDRAIIAVMLGCGLRREEVVRLTVEHLQQREGRWVILDLTGKHNSVRTVPVASWVKSTIDVWTDASGIESYLFPGMKKGGKVQPGKMSAQAIWKMVKRYSPVADLAPHDLRRTFAKTAYRNKMSLEQIQKSLGHKSVKTTEKYVGVDQDFEFAPSDAIPSLLG